MFKKQAAIICAAYLMTAFHALAGELIKEDHVDDLSDTVRRIIAVDSDNITSLNFPDEGDTHLTLVAWKEGSKEYVNGDSEYSSAAFSLERGQISCFKEVCRTRYRIDGGPVRYLDFNIKAADGSTNTAYVEDDYFLSKLKATKKLVIEFPVYSNGIRKFTIDTSVMNEELVNNLSAQDWKKKRAYNTKEAEKKIKEIQ
ncbi:TPA: hypothetical protein MB324_004114, partial [Klebsiella pneumoniae]|nr:hypothetical protein [Klebsiella pneumoniae]